MSISLSTQSLTASDALNEKFQKVADALYDRWIKQEKDLKALYDEKQKILKQLDPLDINERMSEELDDANSMKKKVKASSDNLRRINKRIETLELQLYEQIANSYIDAVDDFIEDSRRFDD